VTPYYPIFSNVFRGIVTYAMGHDGTPPADYADQLTKALEGRR
jgi:hypothetical protein